MGAIGSGQQQPLEATTLPETCRGQHPVDGLNRLPTGDQSRTGVAHRSGGAPGLPLRLDRLDARRMFGDRQWRVAEVSASSSLSSGSLSMRCRASCSESPCSNRMANTCLALSLPRLVAPPAQ